MTKHTPGPWRVVRDGAGALSIASDSVQPDPVTQARYLFVARVERTRSGNPLWRQDEESEPNAALIAAAPDLLAALEMAVATIERIAPKHGPFSSVDGTLSVASAAIAKAEGRR